jgi:hypothetical protein
MLLGVVVVEDVFVVGVVVDVVVVVVVLLLLLTLTLFSAPTFCKIPS